MIVSDPVTTCASVRQRLAASIDQMLPGCGVLLLEPIELVSVGLSVERVLRHVERDVDVDVSRALRRYASAMRHLAEAASELRSCKGYWA